MSSKTSDAAPNELPPSPCRRECCLNEEDVCLGCGRSLGEILEWGKADAARRHAICRDAQARLDLRLSPPSG